MYKKEMRRAAALLAVCWLGLLFRAAAETPAEKLERLRAEQQAIEQQIEQNRTCIRPRSRTSKPRSRCFN